MFLPRGSADKQDEATTTTWIKQQLEAFIGEKDSCC
jgi:hypothetical protein